jgi:hypothetical protein
VANFGELNGELNTYKVGIIKGNASEIARIAGQNVQTKGVDASEVDLDLGELAKGPNRRAVSLSHAVFCSFSLPKRSYHFGECLLHGWQVIGMNIRKVFFEAVSDGADRQAQHPVRNRRDIGADVLSYGIDIIAPDNVGYHRNCMLVPGVTGLDSLQGFPQSFLRLSAVSEVIAHDNH